MACGVIGTCGSDLIPGIYFVIGLHDEQVDLVIRSGMAQLHPVPIQGLIARFTDLITFGALYQRRAGGWDGTSGGWTDIGGCC